MLSREMNHQHDEPDPIQRAYGLLKGGTETGDDAGNQKPWSIPQARDVLDVVSTARTHGGTVSVHLMRSQNTNEIPEPVAKVADRCGLEEQDKEYRTDGILKRINYRTT